MARLDPKDNQSLIDTCDRRNTCFRENGEHPLSSKCTLLKAKNALN